MIFLIHKRIGQTAITIYRRYYEHGNIVKHTVAPYILFHKHYVVFLIKKPLKFTKKTRMWGDGGLSYSFVISSLSF